MIINPYIFGGFDPDAQAFITAANITDNTQKTAINQLVLDLKGYNIWSKMKAIYPFVGGTASTHKFNLKDPRDLDAAFRLVFNGGWTHSSTGALPNGTNGWADTFLNTQDHLSLNSTHISGYSRTDTDRQAIFIGNVHGAVNYELSLWLREANTLYLRINTPNVSSIINNNSKGFYLANRNSSTIQKLIKNNIINNFNVNSNSVSNFRTINLSSTLSSGNTRGFFDNKEFAFSSIGDGLTDTDATNLYNTVQTFQTSLSRQV